jgi:transposase
MRTAPKIELTPTERAQLETWARGRRTEARLVQRAKIVLLAATGKMNKEIAAELGCMPASVCLWRGRFAKGRLAGIEKDAPRGGRKSWVRVGVEAEIVRKTTQEKPANATHWSRSSMAKAMGVSDSTIGRVWKAHGLKPHLIRTFKLSNDPEFAEKVEDIVGLYMSPPSRAVVLSVDEKSQIQALDRTQLCLPFGAGYSSTRTHDYKRNGTTTLFAALNVLDGSVLGTCMPRHTHEEWIKFLKLIDKSVPASKQIHLIADNLQTHKHPKTKRWLSRHPRFHVHFTPTSSSWLNMVERFFRDLTENAIRRGTFKSVGDLVDAIGDYLSKYNEEPKPFVWTAKASDILAKVMRARVALKKAQQTGGGH